jgi:hypothetical protein
MATTGYSDYQTAVRAASAGSLHTRALQNKVASKVSFIDLQYVGRGVELNCEFVDLGSPAAINAKFNPETLIVRHGGSANFSVPVKFEKLTTVDGTKQNGRQFDATWTRSTTTCTVTTPSPHGFSTNQHLNVTNSSATTPVPNGGTGIITVLSDTTFSFTCVNSGATSGTLTVGEIVSAQRAATWSRTTTTLTVTTQGAHGYASNDILDVTAMSSLASFALGLTGVITVTSATAFTFVVTDAGDATGTITLGPARGNTVPITSSVAYTQAAIYTGAGVATVSNGVLGLGDLPIFRKEDKIILVWGVITTVPPTTRIFYVRGSYTHQT